jgi:hypothetical protein
VSVVREKRRLGDVMGFPLLLIPLAIYNIIVLLMPGVSFADPLLTVTLISGAGWPVTLSDMFLAFGILMLLLEVIKGARPGAKYLTDHLLSLVVFGAAAAEFLLLPRFASSTYCLLALLALVDFLSGVALRARRRAPVLAGDADSRDIVSESAPGAPPAPLPVPEPQPAQPPAVTEAAHAPSQEVPSPGLQPGNGATAPPPEVRPH